MGDAPLDTPPAAWSPGVAAARTRRRVPHLRTTLLTGVAALVLAGTSGCSSQPGKEAVADFGDWHADHPLAGITADSAQANDVLPFVGDATFLLASDGTSTPEEALEHYCSYVSGTFVYFDLRYPVRPLAQDPQAGQVTVTLPCEEPETFERSALVENLPGLELADLRDQPRLLFTSPTLLANGLRQLHGRYDARELTLSTEDLYMVVDAAADPEAVDAAADIAKLAEHWPVRHVIVKAGNVNYPAVLNVQVAGNKALVRERIDRIVSKRHVPAKYKVNVTAQD